ncbi:MAG: sugar phosphate isomerase/epimerase [Lachnospiraceae bacterium]|nr:sugar phosphate isomerase/epimerase [Lachnospiraceae bacterium]
METNKRLLKRGVTLFSYSDLLNVCMTMEDCFKDMADMGVTCVEILAGHVENYPNPTSAWIDYFRSLCEKYQIEPGEYGHWYDTRVYQDHYLDVDESLEYLEKDFRIAHLLGFKVLRTKLTALNMNCDPVPGWEKYLEKAIILAEKYDVVMCSEIHRPTALTTQHIQDYIGFIERTGTKHFGFNVDFGIFQNKFPEIVAKKGQSKRLKMPETFSYPEDLKIVLPYTHCCHAKFNYMDDNFEEITIPYKEILQVLKDEKWEGCLISEYEGPRKDEPDFVYSQLRKHQILMKRILGY